MISAVLLWLSSSWAYSVFVFFRKMGAMGLFLLGACDSSFLFIPFSNDLLLIGLVSSGHGSWQWVLYTIAAALGSVLGVFLVDLVMRKAGQEGLEKFVSPKRIEKLKKKMEKHGVRAVFFATLLPPPFPFTAVVVAASALQSSRRGILMAVFGGRLIRFTAVSLLALYFGRKLLRYMRSEYIEYFMYAFIAVAIVGSFLTIRKWLRAHPRKMAQAS